MPFMQTYTMELFLQRHNERPIARRLISYPVDGSWTTLLRGVTLLFNRSNDLIVNEPNEQTLPPFRTDETWTVTWESGWIAHARITGTKEGPDTLYVMESSGTTPSSRLRADRLERWNDATMQAVNDSLLYARLFHERSHETADDWNVRLGHDVAPQPIDEVTERRLLHTLVDAAEWYGVTTFAHVAAWYNATYETNVSVRTVEQIARNNMSYLLLRDVQVTNFGIRSAFIDDLSDRERNAFQEAVEADPIVYIPNEREMNRYADIDAPETTPAVSLLRQKLNDTYEMSDDMLDAIVEALQISVEIEFTSFSQPIARFFEEHAFLQEDLDDWLPYVIDVVETTPHWLLRGWTIRNRDRLDVLEREIIAPMYE